MGEMEAFCAGAHDATGGRPTAGLAMTTPSQLAAAYYLAAQWHDTNALYCEAMAKDEPRLGPDIRARAAENAKHHRGSAAGLRLAATGLERARIRQDQ